MLGGNLGSLLYGDVSVMERPVFEQSSPVSFVQHFSFLSDKNFQTIGQLSSNISEDFAKTESHLLGLRMDQIFNVICVLIQN